VTYHTTTNRYLEDQGITVVPVVGSTTMLVSAVGSVTGAGRVSSVRVAAALMSART